MLECRTCAAAGRLAEGHVQRYNAHAVVARIRGGAWGSRIALGLASLLWLAVITSPVRAGRYHMVDHLEVG
jgi:hypothetical protein